MVYPVFPCVSLFSRGFPCFPVFSRQFPCGLVIILLNVNALLHVRVGESEVAGWCADACFCNKLQEFTRVYKNLKQQLKHAKVTIVYHAYHIYHTHFTNTLQTHINDILYFIRLYHGLQTHYKHCTNKLRTYYWSQSYNTL